MVALEGSVSHVMMVNEKAAFGDEALPPYSVHDSVDAQHVARDPTWKRWLRKRFWIPTSVLVLLVVFGAIFGTVMGVKASKSSSHSYSPTPPAYSASTTYGWYPYPSPSSSTSPDSSILQPQKVPRDISLAAVSPDNLLFWDLREGSTLWKKEGSAGSWSIASDRKFLVAPVSILTGASSHIAVSVDASSGHIVYQFFREGKWDDWQRLEFDTRFERRPAVVSRVEGGVDVAGVTAAGHVWLISYDGSQWSEWTDLGHDITSEVSATSWGPDRLDVFGKRGKTVMHRSWTAASGWTQDWEDLGNPWESYYTDNDLSSAPLAVSWQEEGAQTGVLDVFMTRQGSEHKTLRNNQWSDWTTMYASHEGYEFPDTQSLVKGDGVDGRPFAHLVSRGTSNCIHYNVHNGTNWGFWDYLWCYEGSRTTDYPTQFMPTYLVNAGDGKVELVARDSEDNYIKLRIPGDGKEDLEWPGPKDLWENLGQPA
ncbi:hypothetical protein E8E13_002379 [Curvularia kusanoi]|uniref:Fucose-specific lectin n=1 Tax=Curvularia kusanoi TaxID=90978 RepID=A0A9P4W3U8_CURKU|nr:hypothetical protein E8E13_002379 [Curvularia kusanoi]